MRFLRGGGKRTWSGWKALSILFMRFMKEIIKSETEAIKLSILFMRFQPPHRSARFLQAVNPPFNSLYEIPGKNESGGSATVY